MINTREEEVLEPDIFIYNNSPFLDDTIRLKRLQRELYIRIRICGSVK